MNHSRFRLANRYLLAGFVFICAYATCSAVHAAMLPVTTGLQLHLDTSDIASIEDFQGDHPGDAGFTGNIKRWLDQSTNGYVADAGAAHAAVYATDGFGGSTPVLRFNAGGTTRMAVNSFTHGGDETIFAVFSASSVASGQLFNSNGNPGGGTFVVGMTAGANIEGRVYANNTNSGQVTGPVSAGTPYLYNYVFDDDASGGARLFLNGVSQGTANTNAVGTASPTAYLGNHSAGGSPFSGDLAELIVYDGAMSAQDREQVTDYLNAKYEIFSEPTPSISVNFRLVANDNNSVDADETAGLAPVGGAHWNQILTRSTTNAGVPDAFIAGSTGGNSYTLKDDMGNANAAQLTSTIAPGGGYTNWSNVSGAGLGATGDAGMLQTFLNFGGSVPAETLTISELGPEFTDNGYEVRLYFEGAGTRRFGWTVGGSTVWGADAGDNSDTNNDGNIEWKQATGSSAATANSANHALITGLTDSSFTISAETDTGRAVINGFQIVALPPGSIVEPPPPTIPGRTVLVDFSGVNANAQATDPNGAERWNDVAHGDLGLDTTVATDMIDTTGAGTDFDLHFADGGFATGGTPTLSGGGWDLPGVTTTGFPESATRDGIVIYGGGSDRNVFLNTQLQGLDDSKLYELTFYTQSSGTRDFTSWRINGETKSLSPNQVGGEQNESVTFNNVPTDGSGAIDVFWTSLDDPIGGNAASFGKDAQWSVLKITEHTPIPEPGTFALAALGLFSLVITNRRRVRAR